MRRERVVFRFVKHPSAEDDGFSENFRSDAERGKQPVPGIEHPDTMLGLSVFDSLEQARAVWADISTKAHAQGSTKNKRRKRPVKVGVGDYIAEVLLSPSDSHELAGPPDARGHLTLKGDKDKLAGSVVAVYAASREAI